MLRIQLMCVADVTPITAKLVPGKPTPKADFSTMHVCRNLKKIIEYVEDHAEVWNVWS